MKTPPFGTGSIFVYTLWMWTKNEHKSTRDLRSAFKETHPGSCTFLHCSAWCRRPSSRHTQGHVRNPPPGDAGSYSWASQRAESWGPPHSLHPLGVSPPGLTVNSSCLLEIGNGIVGGDGYERLLYLFEEQKKEHSLLVITLQRSVLTWKYHGANMNTCYVLWALW